MTGCDFQVHFPQTNSVISDGIERQLHTGCQIYISMAGSVLADCGVGESDPGQPMTSDTINLWLSAGKPLTAILIARYWEEGKLELDDRVSMFIPDFANNGKSEITIRQLLTHTCGFRTIETGWPESSWAEVISRICATSVETDWVIGKTAGYHTASSWFILGEIVARLSELPFDEAFRRDLCEPLGMDETWAAITQAQHAEYGHRIGGIYSRERGELQRMDWDAPSRCANPSPGANTRGPIRQLGRFYEMLLNRGRGLNGNFITSQTVDAITARHRVGQFDLTLAHTIDFGLGVILDSNLYGADTVPYGYGRYCSTRTFGHGGAQSSQGWCDPERKLVVAYFFNGRPGEGQHNRRLRQLNEAIYRDLGIATD